MTEDIIQVEDFFVTTRALDKLSWRILPSIREMTRVLNEELQLCSYSYGEETSFFMFVFVVLPTTNQRHETYIIYEEQEIILQYRIPYKQIAISFPRENLSFFANYFLEALLFYKENELFKEKQFDFTQFKIDVADLFETQDWLSKRSRT